MDSTECAVCLSQLTNRSVVDTCGHVFCYDCLNQWSLNHNRCPVCRQIYKSFITNIVSDQVFDEIPVKAPEPVDESDDEDPGVEFSVEFLDLMSDGDEEDIDDDGEEEAGDVADVSIELLNRLPDHWDSSAAEESDTDFEVEDILRNSDNEDNTADRDWTQDLEGSDSSVTILSDEELEDRVDIDVRTGGSDIESTQRSPNEYIDVSSGSEESMNGTEESDNESNATINDISLEPFEETAIDWEESRDYDYYDDWSGRANSSPQNDYSYYNY